MRNFKNAIVTFLSALLLMSLIMQTVETKADVMPPEELSFTPVVFGEITSETQKVIVFSYGDEFVPTTLKVSNGKQTIFKKTYKKSAVRLIEMQGLYQRKKFLLFSNPEYQEKSQIRAPV